MGEIIWLNKRKGGVRVLNIFDVASTFLNFESMTHKKLQKLCYYAQAWHLALYNERLIDGNFEAWVHGPVNSSLYSEYKSYGWNEIPSNDTMPEVVLKKENIVEFINQIYRIYGHLSGDELEWLTHSEEPWKSAREGYKEWEPSRDVINEDIMRKFYLQEFEGSQND